MKTTLTTTKIGIYKYKSRPIESGTAVIDRRFKIQKTK